MESTLLCLGSTLSALLGLLVLGVGAGRGRWRWLWVLLAAVFLIGAGFGAAETVFQFAAEQEGDRQSNDPGVSREAPVADASVIEPIPPMAPALPTVTPTGVPIPTVTPAITATAEPRATPAAEPSPTLVAPGRTTPDDTKGLAAALIPEERPVLSRLAGAPHYVLNITVDFEALTVAGMADVHYTNGESEPLDAVYFRLYPNAEHYGEGQTQVEAVNVDGAAPDFSFEDDARTILKVPLSESLAPGESTRLQIAFRVTVPRRSDRFGYDRGVMSLGHWYPMLAVYDDEGWNLDPYVALGDAFYSDVALFTVHLTVPQGTVVATSGVEVARTTGSAGQLTAVYASGATRDFALALSREYLTASVEIEGTTVTSYYLQGHERGGRQALEVAAGALEVYNERFGRYPYTELDVAETAFTVMGSPGGMEFPGIVFISSDFYRTGGLFSSELDTVVAHEVAHQWWYGVVGNNQVDEPWLDEAFATYASILYMEDKQDPAAAEVGLWTQAALPYEMVRMMGMDGPLQGSLLDYGEDVIAYQALIYGKGALFLDQLRELLGDAAFFRLMQQHYQAHKYQLLARDDFRHSIEEAVEEPAQRTEALALYDAVVVRGEPLENVPGLEGLLGGDVPSQDLEELLKLLEQWWGEP